MSNNNEQSQKEKISLKQFFKEKQWKKWRKDQWLIVFLAGVLLLVIAIPTGNSGEKSFFLKEESEQEVSGGGSVDLQASSYDSSYEAQLEQRLEEILRQIEGVGQVETMITLQDEGQAVVEKDVESSYTMQDSASVTDSSSSSDSFNTGKNQILQQQTSETTIYENQTEEAGPFVSKETRPEIEGVLVVAQGGANAVTAQNISEAIQALFDVEVHKIKIVKMNIQEGTN